MSESPKNGVSKPSSKKSKRSFFFFDSSAILSQGDSLHDFFSNTHEQREFLEKNDFELILIKTAGCPSNEPFLSNPEEFNIRVLDLEKRDEDPTKAIRIFLGVKVKDTMGNMIFMADNEDTINIFKKVFPRQHQSFIQIPGPPKFTMAALNEIKFGKGLHRRTVNMTVSKKKKPKPSESETIEVQPQGMEIQPQANDPIAQIIERIDRNCEDLAKVFSSKLESLFEFTSNLEIVCVPYQSKAKRANVSAEMNGEEESVLEKILKKPKTNTFLDYNFCLKNNVYLENMLKLNVENTVLNEVSLCEESMVAEKETAALVNPKTDKNLIYVYKSNYPNEKQVCIEITKSDLDKVPDNLLNDNIILFYLKLIHNEMIDPDKHNKTYIFNTYFYQKFFMSLNNLVVTQLSDKDYEKGFNAIKKWTKSFDIFEKDFLFIPIHDNIQNHWCLFVIAYPNLLYKRIMNLEENYEEKSIETTAKPMILYFDSFGQLDKNFPIPIRKYLELEFMDKKKEDFARIQSKWRGIDENMLPCYQPLVLFQDNLKDCGIFVLEYTESFLNNPDFILENIEENNNKLNWFPRKLIKMKRVQIKNMILELAKGEDLKTVIAKYQKEREETLKNSKDEKDFDHVDMAEFRNYLASYNLDINHMKPTEKHEHLIKFYISKVQASINSN